MHTVVCCFVFVVVLSPLKDAFYSFTYIAPVKQLKIFVKLSISNTTQQNKMLDEHVIVVISQRVLIHSRFDFMF